MNRHLMIPQCVKELVNKIIMMLTPESPDALTQQMLKTIAYRLPLMSNRLDGVSRNFVRYHQDPLWIFKHSLEMALEKFVAIDDLFHKPLAMLVGADYDDLVKFHHNVYSPLFVNPFAGMSTDVALNLAGVLPCEDHREVLERGFSCLGQGTLVPLAFLITNALFRCVHQRGTSVYALFHQLGATRFDFGKWYDFFTSPGVFDAMRLVSDYFCSWSLDRYNAERFYIGDRVGAILYRMGNGSLRVDVNELFCGVRKSSLISVMIEMMQVGDYFVEPFRVAFARLEDTPLRILSIIMHYWITRRVPWPGDTTLYKHDILTDCRKTKEAEVDDTAFDDLVDLRKAGQRSMLSCFPKREDAIPPYISA